MSDAPIAKLDPTAGWHPDIDTAASQAFKALKGASLDGREHAGVFYSDGKQHSWSAPIASEVPDTFALRAQLQKGHTISGIYHNHPGKDSNAGYFSANDIEVANRMKVPSYILFQDGAIRKYVPGKTRTSSMSSGGSRIQQMIARGDPVTVTEAAAIAQDAAPGVDHPLVQNAIQAQKEGTP